MNSFTIVESSFCSLDVERGRGMVIVVTMIIVIIMMTVTHKLQYVDSGKICINK